MLRYPPCQLDPPTRVSRYSAGLLCLSPFKRLMKVHHLFLCFTIELFPVYGPAQTGPSPTATSAITGATSNSNQTAQSQPGTNPEQAGQNASSTELNPVVVIGQLNEARD
jgi:hypothetical protein